MKTIAVIHPSAELYGADRIMVYALQSLPATIHKVVYLRERGTLADFICAHVASVEIKIFPQLPIIYRSLFTPSGLIKYIANKIAFRRFFAQENTQYNFQSVYVNTLACSLMLPLFSRLNIRSFIHVHEIIEHPRFVAKQTARISAKYADQVVCVSKAVQDNLVQLEPTIKANSLVIHNGIQSISDATNHPFAETPKTFFLFGRLMHKKGQWYLIEALKLLPKELLIGKQFILVGDALRGNEALKVDLELKIKEAGLSKCVYLHGFVPSIKELLLSADVCLVPSLMKDPFPTTVLEAMSAGKPVIATNHGGASEAIENGVSGYLISPNDPAEFASKIRSLIESPINCMAFGKAAQINFKRRFTIEIFNENWLTFNLQHQFI